jgi:hypothetical protein
LREEIKRIIGYVSGNIDEGQKLMKWGNEMSKMTGVRDEGKWVRDYWVLLFRKMMVKGRGKKKRGNVSRVKDEGRKVSKRDEGKGENED